ncbi:hypothetical protein [Paraburkholderia sp. CI3]
MHPQFAARQRVRVARFRIGVVDIGEDFLAAPVIALATLGE